MNIRQFAYSLLFLLSLFCLSCKDDQGPGTDANVVSPALEEIFSEGGQNPNLKCLIVYKDDHIVKEQYFHLGDDLSIHDVRSVTKSVLGTLIGIAIDKGILASEDLAIGNYLRVLVDTLDPAKAGITLRNLLTMTSGLDGNDIPNVSEYNNWFNASNQVQYTLGKPLIHQPGQAFGYNTGACHLASVILTRAAEIATARFAEQHLFQPLGITDYSWGIDRQGNSNGGAALSLTPRDLLKIGQLYLGRGMYGGVRVVSEAWIVKSTTFQINTYNAQPFGSGYGYLWWTGSTARQHSYFFANGYGGQFLVVVPDLQLIVVATNRWSGVPAATTSQQWYNTLSLIMNRIVPLYEL